MCGMAVGGIWSLLGMLVEMELEPSDTGGGSVVPVPPLEESVGLPSVMVAGFSLGGQPFAPVDLRPVLHASMYRRVTRWFRPHYGTRSKST